MDGSKGRPKITAGVDLGDRYSYLCLIDTENGEVIEEGRLRTTPEALRRRFASEPSLRIAIETGTHSPWVSRLLEECGHGVLVANARKRRLIYANKRKTDEVDALRTWLAWPASIRSCFTRWSTGARTPKPTWPSFGLGRRWSVAVRRAREPRVRGAVKSFGHRLPKCPARGASTRERPSTSPRRFWRPSSPSWSRDRLAHTAHPRLRAKAGGDLQGELSRDGALAPGGGSRAAHGAHLRAHRGRSPPLREEPLGRSIPWAGASHRSVGTEGSP
jgi:hypothetical protein